MESSHTFIDSNGQLFLSDEAKAALQVNSGGEVEVTILDRCVEIRPRRRPSSDQDFHGQIAEIQEAFARKPGESSLGDSLLQMRREEEERHRRKLAC